MANRSSRKLTPNSPGDNQPIVGVIKAVSPETLSRQQKGSKLSSIIAIAILLTGAGLVFSFTWFALLLIFNPQQVVWLNSVLPDWAQIPLNHSEHPQTLWQIRDSLSHQKKIVGDTMALDADDNSFLLPVLRQRPNCQSDCQEVVELRVYQVEDLSYKAQPEKFYRLTDQISITGVEESFALAPITDTTSEHQEASNLLPLSAIQRFEGKTPGEGVWFYLQGKRQQGTHAIAYGHILYYNPERANLQQMLSWTSPNAQLPKWQQVTGDSDQELVIDQTVGLEPQLQVYQVKNVKLFLKPLQLEPITLKTAAIKDYAYQNALVIARGGLWTPAFEWLQFIRKQRQGVIPAAAQAQIDLIRLHAQLSKTQADKTWASPSQQVLADLIDGRWQKALQVFEASPQNAQEIANLLKSDKGRLWNRVTAALKVNPYRQDVKTWGALILAVQQGEDRANSWLREQPKTQSATIVNVQNLLKQLQGGE
ncbi:hypothetical protein Nos7524_2718 [Nostoc sp. PCC 7524]|uniref:hypothetical protein n=1 Tax=Nostoc sp. (strain ATCC 29411 / PCC 7524) TaxID=28072 RepID=UPI00029F2305|nr:hypothetical protein [Nostoc sp. PCC 7524]AFY48550.1 hypothetical protein Nos7524_2718 [Nostoc sp. PCC 7524]